MPAPILTYSGSGQGALFDQNGWASGDRANFLRSGNLGPWYDQIVSTASANRVNVWDGAGPFTLRLVPSNNTLAAVGTAGTMPYPLNPSSSSLPYFNATRPWGIILFPRTIKMNQSWEVAINYTLTGTHTRKPAFGFGFMAMPRNVPNLTGTPDVTNEYLHLRDIAFIQSYFYPLSDGNAASLKYRTFRSLLNSSSASVSSQSGATVGADYPASPNSLTETAHLVYNAAAGTINYHFNNNSTPAQAVSGSALSETIEGLNASFETMGRFPNGGWGRFWNDRREMFPYLIWGSQSSSAGNLQGLTINEWGVWGTLGDLRLTTTGVQSSGTPITDDANLGWIQQNGIVYDASNMIAVPMQNNRTIVFDLGSSLAVANAYLATNN